MSLNFKNELSTLVEKEVINSEVAARIENYYKSTPKNTNRLFTIFGVLGATFVGLGIILIIAHNWDIFPKAFKLFFAFLPLIIGQFLVGYSVFKKKNNTWKEASGVFLFFSVGACISLVAQIYNISGDFSRFLLVWILLCSPLIYLLQSKTLAVIHIIFSAYYAFQGGYSIMSISKAPWLYFLLIALIIPFYYTILKKDRTSNISSIFSWIIPLNLIISIGTFIGEGGAFGYLLYVLLFGLFYNISNTLFFKDNKLYQNGYLVLGSLGTLLLFMMTTFDFFWSSFKFESLDHHEFYICLVLLSLNVFVLSFSFLKRGKQIFTINSIAPLLFTILFMIAQIDSILPQVFINLFVLIWSISMIYSGIKKLHFGLSNYGLLVITILIICRFFDTDMSFILRGILFLSVGTGFFLTNYMMLKKIKE